MTVHPAPILAAAARPRDDTTHPDPLLDSLVEVCRLHGHGALRASLAAGLPLVDGRPTFDLTACSVSPQMNGD